MSLMSLDKLNNKVGGLDELKDKFIVLDELMRMLDELKS